MNAPFHQLGAAETSLLDLWAAPVITGSGPVPNPPGLLAMRRWTHGNVPFRHWGTMWSCRLPQRSHVLDHFPSIDVEEKQVKHLIFMVEYG